MRAIAHRAGAWRCVLCGQPSPDQAKPHRGACQCPPGRPGLGDMAAAGLAVVGITKERAQAVAQAVGLEDCGCVERQRQLNAIGYRLGIGEPPANPSGEVY